MLRAKVTILSNRLSYKKDSQKYGVTLNEDNGYSASFYGEVVDHEDPALHAIPTSTVRKDDNTIVFPETEWLSEFSNDFSGDPNHIVQLYNGLDSESEGYALDARQGKELRQQILQLQTGSSTAITKNDVGLGNVDNVSSTTIIDTAKQQSIINSIIFG